MDFGERAVSKVTRGVATAAFGALLCLSAPAKAELLVSISKSQQRLAVAIDGAETFRWPVSTGVRGHETPTGKFRPTRLERHWYSRQYNLTPMPWAMFFNRGYAVHATMEVYNLGRAASHGCVRLRPDNAATLFALMRRQEAESVLAECVKRESELQAALRIRRRAPTRDAGPPRRIPS